MHYNNLNSLRTYSKKNVITLPKEKGEQTVLLNVYPSFPESLELYKIPFLTLHLSKFKHYIIDINYKQRIGITNIHEKKREFINEFKTNVHESESYFSIVLPNYSNIIINKKNNFVYDLSHWVNLFFSNRIKKEKEAICSNFIDFLCSRASGLGNMESYKKIIHIPIDNWALSNKNNFGISKNCLNDPISILLCASYNYPSLLSKLSNYEIIITDKTNVQIMKLVADDFSKNNFYQRFKNQLMKFTKFKEKWVEPSEEDKNPEIDKKEIITKSISKTLTKNFLNKDEIDLGEDFEDEDDVNADTDEFESEIEEEIANILNSDDDLDINEDATDMDEEKVEKIKEKVIKRVVKPKYLPEKSQKVLDNIAKLEKVQNDVLPNIDELKSNIIDETTFEDDIINTSNKGIKKSKFINFDKNYLEKKFENDIDNSIKSLSNADIKVFIVDKEVVDSSTPTDLKQTYIYKLEDENGKKHTIKFDVPKIIDNKYMVIGGNKKEFQRQLILKPLVKISPNVVHITTFYNKALVTRMGKNLNQKTTAIKKLIINNESAYHTKIGNGFIKNKNYNTPIDFDEFAKSIYIIKIKNKVIYFDLKDLDIKLNELKIPFKRSNSKFIFGYDAKTKELLYIDPEKENITDYLEKLLTEDDRNNINKVKVGNKFMYSSMKIMSTQIPVILFLFYCEGFTKIMEKTKINYKFIANDDPQLTTKMKEIEKTNQGMIELNDGYIIWDKYPLENSMLMNGLHKLPFEEYSFNELDNKETFIDIISILFEYRSAWVIMDQFKDFMIDPVTKEILKDFNLPTDLTSLLILANKLLTNNSYINENDLINYRMRNIEMIDQFIYKAVADAYKTYRSTQYKKKPKNIVVKQDKIIKEILSQRVIEDVSSLNPILDIEKNRAITPKGPAGLNEEKSYKFHRRAYDPSMLGVIGVTTTPDAGVGITRQMTLEPKITSTRGYIDITPKEEVENLSGNNLFTPAELLSPPGVIHDDVTRTSMAYKQTKQMMPVKKARPVIIGNKVESILPQHSSNDFSFVAKQNGEIIEKNDRFVILKYKDGTFDSIDISKKMLKNGDNGFWIESQIECNYDVGYKFKAKEVIASDPRFYTPNKDDKSASLNIGVLTKVAILPNYDQFEDSSPITNKLANNLATEIVMESSVFIGKNAYIDSMVKIGDKVKSGDSLISFDESFDDPMANKLFEEFRNDEDLQNELTQMSMKTIKTKYTGEVVDIKIISTLPPEELSDSLKAVVTDYYKEISKSQKILNKYSNKDDLEYYKCGQVINVSDKPVEPKYGKVQGIQVGNGGVIIYFYVKYKNIAKKGDKITHYTALKGIISDVIEEGFEAFTLRKPDEEISTMIAPGAVLARKTPSVLLAMFGNKCMIELTEQIRNFYLNN